MTAKAASPTRIRHIQTTHTALNNPTYANMEHKTGAVGSVLDARLVIRQLRTLMLGNQVSADYFVSVVKDLGGLEDLYETPQLEQMGTALGEIRRLAMGMRMPTKLEKQIETSLGRR